MKAKTIKLLGKQYFWLRVRKDFSEKKQKKANILKMLNWTWLKLKILSHPGKKSFVMHVSGRIYPDYSQYISIIYKDPWFNKK